MIPAPDPKKGKTYFYLLVAPIFLMQASNVLYELIAGTSWGMLVVSLLFAVGLILTPLRLVDGHKLKNVFFALLISGGVFSFYQAGSRTLDLGIEQIGLLPTVTLCMGLYLFLTGIYLLYSEDIELFLKERRLKRHPES